MTDLILTCWCESHDVEDDVKLQLNYYYYFLIQMKSSHGIKSNYHSRFYVYSNQIVLQFANYLRNTDKTKTEKLLRNVSIFKFF